MRRSCPTPVRPVTSHRASAPSADQPAAPASPAGVCGPIAGAAHLRRGRSSGLSWRLALAALLTGLLATGPALTGSTLASAAGPAGSLGSAAAAGSHPTREATARVIVRYRAGASLQTATAGRRQILAARTADPIAGLRHAGVLGQRLGLALRDGRTIAHRTQVIQATGLDSQALARRLASDPEVEFAIVDQRRHIAAAPADPLYSASPSISPSSGQWYLRAPDSTVISSVNAEAAWDITRGNADIVVAVLDTGVRPDHPDLAGRLVAGYDFINDSSVAADGQFTSTSNARDGDPSDPGDWTDANECDPGITATDSSWHGTQTAGLVGAATGNGIGMAGLGRQVLVQPVRVLGRCGGFDSDIVAAMQWAAGITIPDVPANPTPARVINLSLGSSGKCDRNAATNPDGSNGAFAAGLYIDAIAAVQARQAVVVVAAGNDSLDMNLPSNCAGAIGVVGLRHAGTKNGFSARGLTASISAPGGNCPTSLADLTTVNPEDCQYAMLSSVNRGRQSPGLNSYTTSGDAAVGTSFSTPLVSATAALMLSANPGLNPAQVLELMQSSARVFPSTGGGDPNLKFPPASDPVLPGQVPTCSSNGGFQTECYCTTTTCGAGMLDAGAAVRAAAAGVTVANFVASTDYAAVGQGVTLSAAAQPAAGRSISSLLWSIDGGGGSVASLVGSATAGSITLQGGTAAGFVTVRLTVRDSADNTIPVTTAQRISFGAVSNDVVLPGSTVNPGSGGGTTPAKSGGGAVTGDALGAVWLLGLALAALCLRPLRRASRTAVDGTDVVVSVVQSGQRPIRPPLSRLD